ncbi:hypothetical protein GCM10023189_20530 [Nibrella saemangeumensis]|uniref:LVIVD repeat-containing protein n=1 Tax=Nibrella saemangeumensis TaxID=1084526 RepID=A0ABP8MRQ6_9BACT
MKKQLLFLLTIVALLAGCSTDAAKDSVGPGTGTGGSMARFTIIGNYLYVVNHANLVVYDIAQINTPVNVNKVALDAGVETIFPFRNHLMIGTQTGMLVYNLNDPAKPQMTSRYSHILSCDPVVAQGSYAYVTLRSGTACRNGANLLDILDISNMAAPRLVKSYPMSNPHGLGIDGNLLFVTEGDFGLKVFDATNPTDLKLVETFRDIRSFDVIPINKVLIVTGKDGIYQYSYSDPTKLKLLSHLPVE